MRLKAPGQEQDRSNRCTETFKICIYAILSSSFAFAAFDGAVIESAAHDSFVMAVVGSDGISRGQVPELCRAI